jgi:plasmid stabilization system protein ParE
MTFEVIALRRADQDVRCIARWIEARSRRGAESWLDAYNQMIRRLIQNADSCEAALEAAEVGVPLKQVLFGTPRGRQYRAVFLIVGHQVRVLRVRGPGQMPIQSDELI